MLKERRMMIISLVATDQNARTVAADIAKMRIVE